MLGYYGRGEAGEVQVGQVVVGQQEVLGLQEVQHVD